jgi:4-hydroxy-3-polyprenylbenzoate decarboxylase
MPINDLHELIARLESNGDLSRIPVSVDPLLEIAAITNRVCKQPGGGVALLFEHPAGADFPVVTNLFGSPERVCQALHVSTLDELTLRLSALLDLIPEPDVALLDRQIAARPEFNRFAPHAATEFDPELIRMDPPDLARFPFLQSWQGDGAAEGHGRYITLPQVFSTDPDGGTPNCGVYRIQLRGGREAAIQWKAGSGAARHFDQFRRAGKAMPVAIVLGGDPTTLFSAMFPLPGDLDEMTFAGFLRDAPLVTVPCQSVPLRVPIGTEVIIEGYVEPGDSVTEGPFGNHTGFYSPAAPAALMRVTAISHRPEAIIPATVVGPPPMEDCWMAQAWERLLLAFLQKIAPSIKDIRFPLEWIFHQSAIISLENPHSDMVRNISGQLWNLPWFAAARILVFVTAGKEQIGLSEAAWRTINVHDFSERIFLDKARARVVVDATGGTPDRPELHISADTESLVDRRWKEYTLP